jgi:hypothetical protein
MPVKDLKFRCTGCGSARTDFVVMSRDALGVQPWKADDEADGKAERLGSFGNPPMLSECRCW